ncbi:MAG TPA: cytochrome d ubiquinol oxidase subunit II [Anaerolineales bacterium]|jgi:cytochrome d ubiquinol oxidase subunit II|nr:cytochrome d ubiquinol oxidase subunit II [Anaerolineales bacterium]
MEHEVLQIIWFFLIATLWIGFFFLEGFDFGVGMLLPFLGKNDAERRAIINTIGPVWDANEMWLILAVTAMFAVFPNWYATMFSGFYVAMVIIIVGLIIRGISFEYRSKDSRPQWRSLFDWMIAVGSFLNSLLFGIVFTDLLGGVPIDQNLNYTGGPFSWITPYGLIGGVTMLSVFLLHGANFLTLKLDDHMRERARAAAKTLYLFAAVMVVVLAISTYIFTDITVQVGIDPGILPIASVVVLLVAIYFINRKMEGWAFIMTGLNIVLTQVAFFSLMYPRVMVSSMNPAWSLTIYNSSSSAQALTVMSIISLIFIPIVMAYEGWSYYIFRKRIKTEKEHLVY